MNIKNFEILKDFEFEIRDNKMVFRVSKRDGWCDGGNIDAIPIDKDFVDKVSKELGVKVLAKSYSLVRTVGSVEVESYPQERPQYNTRYNLDMVPLWGPIGLLFNEDDLEKFQKILIKEIAGLSHFEKNILHTRIAESDISKCLESSKIDDEGYCRYQETLFNLHKVLQEIKEEKYKIMLVY